MIDPNDKYAAAIFALADMMEDGSWNGARKVVLDILDRGF